METPTLFSSEAGEPILHEAVLIVEPSQQQNDIVAHSHGAVGGEHCKILGDGALCGPSGAGRPFRGLHAKHFLSFRGTSLGKGGH